MIGALLPAIGGILGGLFDNNSAEKAAEKQAQLQREFAQNGVRWKVEDAKAAGIHPLYALGAQTTAYSPVSVGSTDFATGGQNLGSAIQAMTTPKEKADGFAKTVQALTLEKMGLENQVLASQLRVINQPGRGPGMPGASAPGGIDGQGNGPQYTSNGVKVTVDTSNTPAQKWEDQYGEIGGEIGGLSNFIGDVLKPLTGAKGPAQMGANARRELDRSLQKAVKKILKEPRDKIFNENFW